MFHNIANRIKARFSQPSKKEKVYRDSTKGAFKTKNDHAAEIAAKEVVSRYGEALKSLSTK